MQYGLAEKTILQIQLVFSRCPQITKAILYGSRAKGNFKNGSDIDLTLLGENLNLSILNQILYELDELLLPYTMDISIFYQITNPGLLEHIERVGLVFYERKV